MNSGAALISLTALFALPALQGQTLSGPDLVKALRHGGYVIVMRHASSPREKPDVYTADPGNLNVERQLDAGGQYSATAFGKALHHLKIPVGEVFSSPTYRAIETARLANLGTPRPEGELGDNGANMKATTDAQAAWLRKKVADFPSGTNIILITHQPNIAGAFPDLPAAEDGEAIIFGPDGKGGAAVVARVKIDEWPKMKG